MDRPGSEHGVADGVGAAGPARGRRSIARAAPRSALAGLHATLRRQLGRAAIHRHRIPVGLLHHLPPLQAGVPDHGARALPDGGRRGAAGRGQRGRGPSRSRCVRRAAARARGVMLIADAPTGTPTAGAVMARAPSENFPVASRLLPRRARSHLLAVYGFARLADELGDAAPGDRLAALDWLEADLDRAYEGRAEHPLLARLQPTLRECALPREPVARLIAGQRGDT